LALKDELRPIWNHGAVCLLFIGFEFLIELAVLSPFSPLNEIQREDAHAAFQFILVSTVAIFTVSCLAQILITQAAAVVVTYLQARTEITHAASPPPPNPGTGAGHQGGGH